jgi:hypothetical protein
MLLLRSVSKRQVAVDYAYTHLSSTVVSSFMLRVAPISATLRPSCSFASASFKHLLASSTSDCVLRDRAKSMSIPFLLWRVANLTSSVSTSSTLSMRAVLALASSAESLYKCCASVSSVLCSVCQCVHAVITSVVSTSACMRIEDMHLCFQIVFNSTRLQDRCHVYVRACQQSACVTAHTHT